MVEQGNDLKKLLRFVAFTDGQCLLTTASVTSIKDKLDADKIALIRNATQDDMNHFTMQGVTVPPGRVGRAQDNVTTRKFNR